MDQVLCVQLRFLQGLVVGEALEGEPSGRAGDEAGALLALDDGRHKEFQAKQPETSVWMRWKAVFSELPKVEAGDIRTRLCPTGR